MDIFESSLSARQQENRVGRVKCLSKDVYTNSRREGMLRLSSETNAVYFYTGEGGSDGDCAPTFKRGLVYGLRSISSMKKMLAQVPTYRIGQCALRPTASSFQTRGRRGRKERRVGRAVEEHC